MSADLGILESGKKFLTVKSDLLHLLGTVNNVTVSFMIDSGASHNFISITECKRLGVSLSKGPKL